MNVVLEKQEALVCDRSRVNRYLETMFSTQRGSVCAAMRYAVLGAGQRLRPVLALRVGSMLGADEAITMCAAAAIELLHCASLIVDDLPCMDNEQLRRNRPAVHREFGEATAVLAAFALVAMAARSVADHPRFQLRLLGTLDCNSLIGGQALDLAMTGERRDEHRARVTHMKTVPLFQLAVEAGILGARDADLDRAGLIRFGTELGAAYQSMDDFLDGETNDPDEVDRQFSRARALLAGFDKPTEGLLSFLDDLNARIREEDRRHR